MKDCNKIIIFLLLVLIVSIILNSVFNFTSIIQENYQDLLEAAATQQQNTQVNNNKTLYLYSVIM